MRYKKSLILLLVFTLSLSLVGCGGGNEATDTEGGTTTDGEKNVLTFGGKLEGVDNLDFHLKTTTDVLHVGRHIQEGLLGLNEETMEVEPLLVTDLPEVSEDGLTYSFELKPDVKFHDGTVLTSNDVKFTFERIFDPATKNAWTWLCDMIVGSEEMLEGEATELEGFKVIDDTHFEITVKEPCSSFMSILAADAMAIYPEKACKEAGETWGSNTYIGTGPFKVIEFDSKNKVVLEKFEDYHNGAKELDEIVFLNMDPNTALLEFENGTIDVTALDIGLVDQYLEDDEMKDNVNMTKLLGIITLGFNKEMEPLDDVKVREAVGLAVDRNTLTKNYFRGQVEPAKCFIPEGVPGYDESAPELEYNPEKAKKLLAEAGYPDGIELTCIIFEESSLVPVLEILQEQFKKSNIDLEIQKVDKAAHLEIRGRGEKQLSLMDWYADYIDADNFFTSILYGENSKSMSTNYFNDEFDAVCDEAKRTIDLDEKIEIYKKMEHKATHEDFIVSPLYIPVTHYLVSDRIEGATLMPTALYKFEDAKVVE